MINAAIMAVIDRRGSQESFYDFLVTVRLKEQRNGYASLNRKFQETVKVQRKSSKDKIATTKFTRSHASSA